MVMNVHRRRHLTIATAWILEELTVAGSEALGTPASAS
jgi:hypothetical protein